MLILSRSFDPNQVVFLTENHGLLCFIIEMQKEGRKKQACMLMRDEKEGEISKQGHTNNKVKQHNTPKAVTFPKKNQLPRVGLETHDTPHSGHMDV